MQMKTYPFKNLKMTLVGGKNITNEDEVQISNLTIIIF